MQRKNEISLQSIQPFFSFYKEPLRKWNGKTGGKSLKNLLELFYQNYNPVSSLPNNPIYKNCFSFFKQVRSESWLIYHLTNGNNGKKSQAHWNQDNLYTFCADTNTNYSGQKSWSLSCYLITNPVLVVISLNRNLQAFLSRFLQLPFLYTTTIISSYFDGSLIRLQAVVFILLSTISSYPLFTCISLPHNILLYVACLWEGELSEAWMHFFQLLHNILL